MGKKRKVNWLGNAIWFNLSKLIFKRDPNLWVFGSFDGKKYDDNAKYLFEHVRTHHLDKVRPVWLAGDGNTLEDVRNSGGEAYCFRSREGKRIARKAGVAIYTHALADFGYFPQVGGAKLVFLGHGVGFKQTYNAKRHGIGLRAKKFSDRIFSWIKRDITISTSEYNKLERMKIASLKDDSKIYLTGQPRNDLLKRPIDRNRVLSNVGIDIKKRVVLYMPTYRRVVDGVNSTKEIVKSIYDSNLLSDTLDNFNYIFVAKLHPNTPHIDIPQRENFLILDANVVAATQELQAVSDILVTDYSSCCVDFALTGKPVIFYLPDEKWFLQNSEQVSREFHNISMKNKCTAPDGLAKLISCPSLSATIAINELFEDPLIKGTCYSENVYKVICKEIGL